MISKKLLFPLWIGPKIIKDVKEIDMNCNSKIGFVVKLAFGLFTSKTQTSLMIPQERLLDYLKIREIGVEISY